MFSTTSYTYVVPNDTYGIVFETTTEVISYTMPEYTRYNVTFYDTSEDTSLTFQNIYAFMNNVDTSTRVYALPNAYQYFFKLSYDAIPITGFNLILFVYNVVEADSDVVLIDPNGNIVSTIGFDTFTSTTLVYREISTITQYDIGQREGYAEGYQDGIDDNTSDTYDQGYLDGYSDGEDNQYAIDYALWYVDRYQQGLTDLANGAIALTEFVPGILGVVFAFFFQLASIEFLGISILEVLTALFGIGIAIFIIKIFT